MKARHLLPITKGIIALALIMPVLMSVLAHGQETASFKSNEVHPDGSITFRYKDPAAGKVLLNLEGAGKPLAMEKDSDGVWSVVTPPLPPEIYGYGFEVDGRSQLDPKNPVIKPNLIFFGNLVTVPGSVPQLWEPREVPHGVVHHHFYTSKVVNGLVDGQSEYYVYTPPSYDLKRTKPYPVLYLLHGWSDTAAGWTAVGQANFIFDNLIAEGKVKPMLVVMPLGYGDMKFVSSGFGVWDDDAVIDHNVALFSQALLTEVLPQVESGYHVSKNRNDRAITGLSMGGLESLTIGLTHPGQFGWVGGFSSASAMGHLDKDERLATLSGKSAALHLLWVACGTEDDLITPNRKLIAWLKTRDVPLTAIETPGMHTWMVWRDNLAHFAPLLFQKK
ncbi:MAG TPA: alpha/beta hydrolase-fold protein [Terriglobales bacterium]|jgi:enterochelin esterase family protein